jgi:GTPase
VHRMTDTHQNDQINDDSAAGVVERVLRNADSRAASSVFAPAQAIQTRSVDDRGWNGDGEQYDREDRAALRRVAGLSTELEDVTEVEYRQLRLEQVVLIGVYPHGDASDAENSLRELAALAETAGAVVLDGLLQRRPNPDPSTYLGKGKAEELAMVVKATGADTVIADTELAPSQRRALEDVVKVKVIDRTAVILDIFSQHAKSREGKAQVELAQLEYLLPRLRGWGESAVPAWAPVVPVRRRSSSTDAASTPGCRSSVGRSRASVPHERPNGPIGTATTCRASRSPATRTPASPRC